MWIPPPSSSNLDLTFNLFELVFADNRTGSDKHHHHNGGAGPQLREWSSIIGIVTAIIGNVLISFALNIQRYAHIRIDREYTDTHQLSVKPAKGASGRQRGYGTTTQENIAQERARLHATAPGPGGPPVNGKKRVDRSQSYDEEDDADETDPLKNSFESAETLNSFEKDASDGIDGRKSYLRSGYWWVGIILMTVGEAGNFIAYGFAPASVVSPLGVVALISNCLIAPLMLKERFRQRDFWGVLVAVAGAVTIVLSAKNSETKMGPDDLWWTIKRWEFLAYLGITAGVITTLMFASPRYGERTILIDLGLVGLFGAYTALSTKGVASLLSDTLWRAFTFPITYLLVAILVLSALMQIRYVNRALQHFDSTQVIPTQFVLFTISVIIGSAVLYRDFESTTATRVGEFTGGCFLTFFGVYLITSGRPRGDEGPPDGDASDEDERINLIDEEIRYQGGGPDGRRRVSSISQTLPKVDKSLEQHSPAGLATPEHRQSGRPSESTEGLSYRPSMAATTETMASASSNLLDNTNPLLSFSEQLEDAPASEHPTRSNNAPSPFNRSQSDIPQTPIRQRIPSVDNTPFYTAASKHPNRTERVPAIVRTVTGPANPETPTRASRTVSPPKADAALRPPPTPSRSARGSIARLTPGPLLTPLSSSLSAVIVDSLRRGEGTSQKNRLRLRRGRTSQGNVGRHHSLADGEDLSRQQTHETAPDPDVTEIVGGESSVAQKKGRLRSVSDVLGGLMGRQKKSRPKDEDQDEEDGGHGVGGRGGALPS